MFLVQDWELVPAIQDPEPVSFDPMLLEDALKEFVLIEDTNSSETIENGKRRSIYILAFVNLSFPVEKKSIDAQGKAELTMVDNHFSETETEILKHDDDAHYFLLDKEIVSTTLLKENYRVLGEHPEQDFTATVYN